MPETAADAAAEIIEEFSFFDDWADRYQHLIDQGRRLTPIAEAYRNDAYKLQGCQSTVYFAAEKRVTGDIHYAAESDAAIVQGLVALLLRVYSGRPAKDILATEPTFLEDIGLDKHLSPTRKNGLASMMHARRHAAETL